MKYLFFILLAFTISAAVAQSKPANFKIAKPQTSRADSILTFKLTIDQTKALLGCMETTINLLPRSADLTALQANETQKQIYTLGKLITDQLPKTAARDSISKK